MRSSYRDLIKLYADREYTGNIIALSNVSHSRIRECEVMGQTIEVGEGEKAPDNPFQLVGCENPVLKIGEQSMTIPYTLNGIPVTSGGNDTDGNGQQWLCDTYNPLTGEYVQRTYLKLFNANDTWRAPAADDVNAVFAYTFPNLEIDYSYNLVCNIIKYRGIVGGYAAALKLGVGLYKWSAGGTEYLYFVVPITIASTLDEWFDYLQVNAVQTAYVLDNPVITDLDPVNIIAGIPSTIISIEEVNGLGSIRTTLQTKE